MSHHSSCLDCPPTWKKVLAFFVDFIGSFYVFGFLVAYFSGDLTGDGFSLSGMPAFFMFALIITYFIIMKKYFGGTVGKKIFGIAQAKH